MNTRSDCGTIQATKYVRLTCPVTGAFVGEYDPERGLLLVKRRGHETVFDLARIAEEWRQKQGE